jgi:DNA-binding HxlR family transcriptional regulator
MKAPYTACLFDASTHGRLSGVLGKTYDRENCSAARALELVGERWSLLIVRDALFRGARRFADFQRSLGLASNVLAARLDSFVAAGIMEPCTYSSHQDHYEYLLTEKGRDLAPVVVALTAWGDRWAAPNGPPIVYQHEGCGGRLNSALACGDCGQLVAAEAIEAQPGPGSRRPRGHHSGQLRSETDIAGSDADQT